MNYYCSTCANMRYIPAAIENGVRIGIGMHWCDALNTPVRFLQMCKFYKEDYEQLRRYQRRVAYRAKQQREQGLQATEA